MLSGLRKGQLALTMLLFGFACSAEDVSKASPDPSPAPVAINEPIQPIPVDPDLDKRKIHLGKRLFSETALSKDRTISCATCHNLNTGGTDRLTTSRGMAGQIGKLNSPTVPNARFNFKQFWDGRAETLEEQVDGPLTSDHEMAISWDEVITRLKADADYIKLFHDIYGRIDPDAVKNAIAEFERSLITPNGRFDRYLRGEQGVLTEQELGGYKLFKDYGCVTCHQGIGVGGNMFESFGVMGDYFADRGEVVEADLGRFNVTGLEKDRFVFKVPSLRNVALTPPYFHDGSTRRLKRAVAIMANTSSVET